MRIFAASIATETNTFSPWPTGRQSFDLGSGGEDVYLATVERFGALARGDGHEFRQGPVFSAEPSGPVLQFVYEAFRDELLRALKSALPVDVVLLPLHGAMVATQCDDCEGDLLCRIREMVGPSAVVGIELDPHCHITPRMTENANLIVILKEYPHTDYQQCGDKLYELCVAAARGKIRPCTAVFDCRMIGFYPTTAEPMASIVRHMRDAESAVLSVGFAHGFPWGDTEHTGSKVVVAADGDQNLAGRVAAQIGNLIYENRYRLEHHFPNMQSALADAEGRPGRVVLADIADNPGGGAPGDNVGFLRFLLENEISNAALGVIYDPMAARVCAEAGVGASFRLRIGGKSGDASGLPLDADVRVHAIKEHHWQRGFGGVEAPLGLSAWVESNGVDIVISSHRTQTLSPEAFTGLGIDLGSKKLIVVKSTQHFRALFSPLADRIIAVGTSGALDMNFAAIPYRKKKDLGYFPRVKDPLGSK